MRTKVTKMRKAGLFFKAVKRKLGKAYDDFTQHEPVVKSEAIERTLTLLRRDFDMAEQNEIVISLVQRLHDKREADLIKLQETMDKMKEQSDMLKEKVVLT
jgi:hypothetical protein